MSEWCGRLPERWETKKISELFAERREKVSDIDFAPLSVSKGGIVPQIATVAKSNAGDNRKLVRKGDFAINSRSDRRGSSGLSEYDGSVSLINIVLTPRNETNGRYWHYLLKSHPFIEEYYRNGRGIVADLWTTRLSEMKTIYLPVPTHEEQNKIVRFLDWKVSGINRLINAKKKQIALLGEQKRAIINEAVTRGDWTKRQIKQCAAICNGKDYKAIEINEGGYPVMGSGGEFARASKYIYNKPSVLFGRKGTVDKPIYVDFPFWSVDTMFYTIVHDDINPKYLLYASSQIRFDYYKTSTAIPSMTQHDLGSERIPMPPLIEQKSIVIYLDEKCEQFDTLIVKLNDEITLFAEYRTRLISDVVTGKMDVRGVAVPGYKTVMDVAEDEDVEEVGNIN